MTIANADWLLTGDSLLGIMQDYGNRYHSSYGSMFYEWLRADNPQPYNSWGNGTADRKSTRLNSSHRVRSRMPSSA